MAAAVKGAVFECFDPAARRVLETAWAEAAALHDHCVGTEHLLLALATSDPVTATLLAEAGATPADIRRRVTDPGYRRHGRGPDDSRLLESLGIDLPEVRRRAERTFGQDALTRAARRARPRRPRRLLWSWISCSRPLPPDRCDSPLTGRQPAPIPRVKRLLERAARTAGPGSATPAHLLLVLLAGNEPACEVLTALGVDLEALASATRRSLSPR